MPMPPNHFGMPGIPQGGQQGIPLASLQQMMGQMRTPEVGGMSGGLDDLVAPRAPEQGQPGGGGARQPSAPGTSVRPDVGRRAGLKGLLGGFNMSHNNGLIPRMPTHSYVPAVIGSLFKEPAQKLFEYTDKGITGIKGKKYSMKGAIDALQQTSDPYKIASQYIGAGEQQMTPVLGSAISKILGTKGSNPTNVAWCAAFVNHALKGGTGSLMARSYLDYGKKVDADRASQGDIAIFTRGKKGSGKGHVGFFTGRQTDDKIEVLGGNQNNRVSKKWYSKKRLLGLRRPTPPMKAIPRKLQGSN